MTNKIYLAKDADGEIYGHLDEPHADRDGDWQSWGLTYTMAALQFFFGKALYDIEVSTSTPVLIEFKTEVVHVG